MKRPTFLPYLTGLLLMNATAVFAGQTTLTTYYPAPNGNYEQISADQVIFRDQGATPTCPAGSTALINSSGNIQKCASDGSMVPLGGAWTQSGNYIYPANTVSNPNINVGIGVTAPLQKLHVYTTTGSDGIEIDGTTNPGLRFDASGTVKAFLGLPTAAGAYSTDAAANDLVMRTESVGQKILFNVNGGSGASMAAFNNGNVGIGVTIPVQKLHVKNGDVFIDRLGTNASLGLRNGGGSTWFTQGSMLMSIGFGNFPPVTPGTSGPINIDAFSGKIAIGSPLTANKLDVAGGGATIGYASGAVPAAPANGLLVQGNIGTPGSASIGMTSPVNKLDVVGGGMTVGFASGAVGAAPLNGLLVNNMLAVGSLAAGGVKFGIVGNSNAYGPNTPIIRLLNQFGGSQWDMAVRYDGGLAGAFVIANPAAQLIITNAGGVGIGVVPVFKLDVGGNTRIQGTLEIDNVPNLPVGPAYPALCRNGLTVGTCTNLFSSSRRYKEDIQPLLVDKNKVLQLKPVSFKWKTNHERGVGLIAEDAEPLVPELVVYQDKQIEGVNYDKVGVYLLSIVKEHEQRLNDVQKRDMVLHDTDGTGCHKITVNSTGALSAAVTACP